MWIRQFPFYIPSNTFAVWKQLLYVWLDADRCRPVVFSLQLTNLKWTEHQRCSSHRVSTQPSFSPDVDFPPGLFVVAQALSMQLEKTESVKRAWRITADVALRKENIQWKRKRQLNSKFKSACFQCKTLHQMLVLPLDKSKERVPNTALKNNTTLLLESRKIQGTTHWNLV